MYGSYVRGVGCLARQMPLGMRLGWLSKPKATMRSALGSQQLHWLCILKNATDVESKESSLPKEQVPLLGGQHVAIWRRSKPTSEMGAASVLMHF